MSVGVDSQLLFYPPPLVRVEEMILTLHGLMRLHRRTGPRRPYAEAVAGIKGFSYEQNTRIGTSSYGVGAGMQFPFAQTRAGTAKQEVVEIGVRYLRGGGARVNDQRFTSGTHAVEVHIGWGIRF